MGDDLNYRLKTLLRLNEECREVEEKRSVIEMQLEQMKFIWFDPMFTRRPKTWDEINEAVSRELNKAKIEHFDSQSTATEPGR